MADLRMVIIADDPLARTGLGLLLMDQPSLMVVDQISGSDDVLAAIDLHQPDVLLWDLGWAPESSLAQLADVAEDPLAILVLLPSEDAAAEAWAAGASGLLRRDAELDRLVAALHAVANGLAAFDSTLVAAVAPVRDASPDQLVETLSPRELEVLRLMAEGLPNKTIALQLGISQHTVKFHVNAILGKLGVGSRTEAVVRATRLGLIIL